MPTPQAPILPARFRLNEEALRDFQVSVLEFPFTDAIYRFLDGIKQIRSNGKIWDNEYPTWRTLNDVLLLLTPTLTHAFERQWDAERGINIRQMVVIGEQPELRPSLDDLTTVIQPWLSQWVASAFKKEIDGSGRYLYEELMGSLETPEADWQVVSAYELWQSPNRDAGLSYRAIPSLICSLLNEQTSMIFDTPVKWRLAHDRNGFVIVSEPQSSEYLDDYGRPGEGTFAYKLEFRIQTQAGRNAPRWLHLYVRCQRYADRPISKVNYGRDVSLLIGTDKPRLTGWERSGNLVVVTVSGKPGGFRWQKGVPELLQVLKARELVQPDEIFAQPDHHRQHDGDEYYVIYAEGMKYGIGPGRTHGVKTGYSLGERSAVVGEVASLLQRVASPSLALAADQEVRKSKRPIFMRTAQDLKKSHSSEDGRLQMQQMVLEALRRALRGQPLQITICASTTTTQHALLQGVRDLLCLSEGEAAPERIQIILTELSGDLGNEIDWDTASDIKRRKLALQDKSAKWQEFLSSYRPQRGYHLALVEIGEMSSDRQDIKGAVRQSCVNLNIASQMINPIKPTAKLSDRDKGRIQNAVADLLLRQTGALFGLPADLYRMAGLPENIAGQLTAVALYRRQANRTNTRKGMNFAWAVRLLPDGQVEGRLNDGKGWRAYLDATLAIGKTFLANAPYETAQNQKIFAADILTGTKSPTLALVDAISWRSTKLLSQLANDRMKHDELDFADTPGYNKIYKLPDLPRLRLMRIREVGSKGETPQYVSTQHGDWHSIETTEEITSVFGAGFRDIYAGDEFIHYLSIGRLPKTASRHQQNKPKGRNLAKSDFGGSVGFRHQTAIEFVPFFLQSDDDPLGWCRAAHYLRFSPAWDGGNTIRPFPLHLAHTAVEDMMCLLGYGAETDEVD